MTDRRQFRAWVRWLRRKFPSVVPVRVELVPPSRIPGHHGLTTCTLDDDTGAPVSVLVQIASDAAEPFTRDTLNEEWAHALRWHLPGWGDPENHDQVYGAIFNAIKDAYAREL